MFMCDRHEENSSSIEKKKNETRERENKKQKNK